MSEEEEEKKIVYKFALLGDSKVGKTTIFKKIFTNKFSEFNLSSIGVDIRTLNYEDLEISINGQTVKKSFDIKLFDTAGQERFRSVTTNYIKGSDGIILIYDITNKESFNNVKNWLKSITEVLSDWKSSSYFILLLGNKLDLTLEDKNLEDDKKKRQVNIEEGENLCKDSGIFWGGECSAKDFTEEQFKELFGNFVIKIFQNIKKEDIQRVSINKNDHKNKKKKKFC